MRQRQFNVVCILALTATGAWAAPLCAQSGKPPRGTEFIRLQVRPRVGDTLHLLMEQSIEVSGRTSSTSAQSSSSVIERPPSAPAPRTPDIGPLRGRSPQRITRLHLFAHSLVESSDLSATTLLATTDSMVMWAGDAADGGAPQRLALPIEGRQVRVRVSPDGAMRVNDPPPGAMELGSTLAAMPGMLPETAVQVGDQWDRDIPLPSMPVSGFRADGFVRARFRLDSLTRRGRDAWISLSGTLQRDGGARDLPAGTRVVTAGTMRGVLVVDRDRAWIVDARTVIDVQSDVSPGPTTQFQLDIRILQHVRMR